MKGIILAGGSATRLYPLTKYTNKHLLPIGNKQMIFYPLDTLINGGVTSILLISSPEHIGNFCRILGDKYRGISLFYKVQDFPSTVPDTILLSKDFIGNEKFVCILGDSIYTESLDFNSNRTKIFVKTVDKDLNEFALFTSERIIEKPSGLLSGKAVTGCYVLSPEVFNLILSNNFNSISDLLNKFSLDVYELLSYWNDAGTHKRILEINNYLSLEYATS